MGARAVEIEKSRIGSSGEPRSRPVLVVGYDGSPNARAALAYAARRAGTAGQVVVAHVYGPAESWFGTPSYQPEYEDYRPIRRTLEEAVEQDIPEHVHHETVLRRGLPPDALVQIAAERDADEIVVGAHGSDPRRRGLGDVALALIQMANRPVVIIPSRAARFSAD
jgi:nucleotide-binding universal stress UspA family protein